MFYTRAHLADDSYRVSATRHQCQLRNSPVTFLLRFYPFSPIFHETKKNLFRWCFHVYYVLDLARPHRTHPLPLTVPRFEDPPRFSDEIEQIRAHQWQAEDHDVSRAVCNAKMATFLNFLEFWRQFKHSNSYSTLLREVRHVARRDTLVNGDKVKGAHLKWKFIDRWTDKLKLTPSP